MRSFQNGVQMHFVSDQEKELNINKFKTSNSDFFKASGNLDQFSLTKSMVSSAVFLFKPYHTKRTKFNCVLTVAL